MQQSRSDPRTSSRAPRCGPRSPPSPCHAELTHQPRQIADLAETSHFVPMREDVLQAAQICRAFGRQIHVPGRSPANEGQVRTPAIVPEDGPKVTALATVRTEVGEPYRSKTSAASRIEVSEAESRVGGPCEECSVSRSFTSVVRIGSRELQNAPLHFEAFNVTHRRIRAQSSQRQQGPDISETLCFRRRQRVEGHSGTAPIASSDNRDVWSARPERRIPFGLPRDSQMNR